MTWAAWSLCVLSVACPILRPIEVVLFALAIVGARRLVLDKLVTLWACLHQRCDILSRRGWQWASQRRRRRRWRWWRWRRRDHSSRNHTDVKSDGVIVPDSVAAGSGAVKKLFFLCKSRLLIRKYICPILWSQCMQSQIETFPTKRTSNKE